MFPKVGFFLKIIMNLHFFQTNVVLNYLKLNMQWFFRCSPGNIFLFSHKHHSMKHDSNFYFPSKDKHVVVCRFSSSFLCRRTFFFSLWRANPRIIKHGGRAHDEKVPLPCNLQRQHQNVHITLHSHRCVRGIWCWTGPVWKLPVRYSSPSMPPTNVRRECSSWSSLLAHQWQRWKAENCSICRI